MTVINLEMQKKLQRALDEAKEFYTVQDILDEIRIGKLQSFAVGDSWAVTQVVDFPRRRMLEVFLVVGHLRDIDALSHKVEEFAVESGATVIRCFGRDGFEKVASKHGWTSGQRIYYKEL